MKDEQVFQTFLIFQKVLQIFNQKHCQTGFTKYQRFTNVCIRAAHMAEDFTLHFETLHSDGCVIKQDEVY